MTRARAVILGAGGVLILFALLAGEYSTLDWLSLRRTVAEERAALAALRAEIDSLQQLVTALETSRAAQERAAREEFGMIKDGELLYRLVPDDR
jgi:cell division protein FtsB